jgi:hypothetical protein
MASSKRVNPANATVVAIARKFLKDNQFRFGGPALSASNMELYETASRIVHTADMKIYDQRDKAEAARKAAFKKTGKRPMTDSTKRMLNARKARARMLAKAGK